MAWRNKKNGRKNQINMNLEKEMLITLSDDKKYVVLSY